MKKDQLKRKAFVGAIWNCATSVGTQIVSFIIQIVLARILEPETYGTIALITIFIAVANVFINTGYASALIQKKEIDETDCSTSFFIGIILSIVLYIVLFNIAPLVAIFYSNNQLISILRVQSLTIILGSLCSVQNALLNRNLEFKKLFFINLAGIIAQGMVGIFLALRGYETWALVCSYLANRVITTIMTWKMINWRPHFLFSLKAFKELFDFSSKVLVFTLVDTIFSNIKSLIIGKKYSEETLAYYNRGNHIPTLISNDAIGAINNVLFPTLSRCKENPNGFKETYRVIFRLMFYISLPVYFGLIAVAEPLTFILLTEKWANSVVFMQLICITLMFNPFFVRTHVYNAIGRSDISMWLSLSDKLVIMILLIVSVLFGDVYTLVFTSFVSNTITTIVGMLVNRKYLQYTIKEQLLDALASFTISLVMFILVYYIGLIIINNFLKLFLQVLVGVAIYILLSYMTNNSSYIYILSFLKKDLKNK